MQYYGLGQLNQDDFTLFGDKEKFWKLLESIFYMVPMDNIDHVKSNCVFLMMDTETLHGAGFINKKLIKGKSVIAFHDSLYSQDEDVKAKMILHEIAHFVLNHCDEGLPGEYPKQEKAADALRDKWIEGYVADQGLL